MSNNTAGPPPRPPQPLAVSLALAVLTAFVFTPSLVLGSFLFTKSIHWPDHPISLCPLVYREAWQCDPMTESRWVVSSPEKLTMLFSNARLRGASSKPVAAKGPVSPSDDGQLASPSLSQASHSSTSLASAGLTSKLPPLPSSPSLSQSIGIMGTGEDALLSYHLPQPLPLWLNPAYAKHIVKGNFMTLSARPKTVEQGEWIAHQGRDLFLLQSVPRSWICWHINMVRLVVEHYRNLWNFVRVIYEKEDDGKTICNPTSCPRMSAGA